MVNMTMTKKGLRQRKTEKLNKSIAVSSGLVPENEASSQYDLFTVFKVVWFFIGFFLVFYTGYWFYGYMRRLHELNLWFTNIGNLEREISLRTEVGFYYSFYKQLVESWSFWAGIDDLKHDIRTEHGRTINVLQRFNVYQEVSLAALYRWLDAQSWWSLSEPILFYVYCCFILSGLSISILYLLVWSISGFWPAAFLSSVWLVVNLEDSSRVFFAVNLRENFALPFFWLQTLSVCLVVNYNNRTLSLSALFLISSFFFALMWQFNQYVFLLQAIVFYSLSLLKIVSKKPIQLMLFLQWLSLLFVWLVQYRQPMLPAALTFSFNLVAILSLSIFSSWNPVGTTKLLAKLFIESIGTFVSAILLNLAVKRSLHIDEDAHIWTFVRAKFAGDSFADSFESRLYLCHGAFAFIEQEFFVRTTRTGVLPLYLLSISLSLIILISSFLNRNLTFANVPISIHRPAFTFIVLQSLIFGLVALTTLRIKYLWFPQMAIVSSLFCHLLLSFKLRPIVKVVIILLISSVLIVQYKPTYDQQMADEKEFYDPDTVQLMEWIMNSTPSNASFTASMQLLAGVKCCTGRHLTNHPHFEDKWLRDRTRRLYQIYGRKSARDVAEILRNEGTNYIILEDSICLAPSDGCRIPDLIDLENGNFPEKSTRWTAESLTDSKTERFCNAIRNMDEEFGKYFRKVFANHTFRVYLVLLSY